MSRAFLNLHCKEMFGARKHNSGQLFAIIKRVKSNRPARWPHPCQGRWRPCQGTGVDRPAPLRPCPPGAAPTLATRRPRPVSTDRRFRHVPPHRVYLPICGAISRSPTRVPGQYPNVLLAPRSTWVAKKPPSSPRWVSFTSARSVSSASVVTVASRPTNSSRTVA